MLHWEIMAVCSEIHIKYINTLCGQNVQMLNVKLAVHIVTTGLQKTKEITNVFCWLKTLPPPSVHSTVVSYKNGQHSNAAE